jgi:glutamine---fructose-6-phosphate transaminase (isomerizing)
VFNTESDFYHKNISNIKEIQARNGVILGVITEKQDDKEIYDDVIEVPKTSFVLSPFTTLIAMYLFSLYFAQELGREIDKPRNLAKSVTVE